MSRILTSASRYTLWRLAQASDHEGFSWLVSSPSLYPFFSFADGNYIHVLDMLRVHLCVHKSISAICLITVMRRLLEWRNIRPSHRHDGVQGNGGVVPFIPILYPRRGEWWTSRNFRFISWEKLRYLFNRMVDGNRVQSGRSTEQKISGSCWDSNPLRSSVQ